MMLELGSKAPAFELPDANGKRHSLEDFVGAPGLVVMFISNHCPFVKLIRDELATVATQYQRRGIAFVGINSNDVDKYPDDSPIKMLEESRAAGYTFPYLFDETQNVAKNYLAACTPDIYVFDRTQSLVYRGQFDAARPGNGIEPSGADLRNVLDNLLENKRIASHQIPSIGCNIKWKPGNEPAYFG